MATKIATVLPKTAVISIVAKSGPRKQKPPAETVEITLSDIPELEAFGDDLLKGLFAAGFGTPADVRKDITENDGKGLLGVSGIGPARLKTLDQVTK